MAQSAGVHRCNHLEVFHSHLAPNFDAIIRVRPTCPIPQSNHGGNRPCVPRYLTICSVTGCNSTFTVQITCCNPQFLTQQFATDAIFCASNKFLFRKIAAGRNLFAPKCISVAHSACTTVLFTCTERYECRHQCAVYVHRTLLVHSIMYTVSAWVTALTGYTTTVISIFNVYCKWPH